MVVSLAIQENGLDTYPKWRWISNNSFNNHKYRFHLNRNKPIFSKCVTCIPYLKPFVKCQRKMLMPEFLFRTILWPMCACYHTSKHGPHSTTTYGSLTLRCRAVNPIWSCYHFPKKQLLPYCIFLNFTRGSTVNNLVKHEKTSWC